VLTPTLPQERQGTIANVVFPTGIDRRDDLGSPDRFDVYYGMADYRIGVARLDVPDFLPPGEVVAHQRAPVINARLRDQLLSATWATATPWSNGPNMSLQSELGCRNTLP
jgi:hypothetical protein